jgi:SAM-dependent methyltransferase
MDVQKLDLMDDQFAVAVVAFVLFHLPRPDRCLREVARVLVPGGMVGTVTWGIEQAPHADAIWDEELDASGATVLALPAVDNRGCCDNQEKIAAQLTGAGFGSVRAWTEPIEHHWPPDEHFEYQMRSGSRFRLLSLPHDERDRCVERVRDRLSGRGDDQYVFRGEVVMATAVKPAQVGDGEGPVEPGRG